MKWPKIVEKTLGAVRHMMEHYNMKGFFPVGFSIVFYNPDEEPEKRWHYDLHNIIDPHEPPDLYNEKVRERVDMVNQFLAMGVKKILEGEIDDNERNIDGTFQIPGVKGRG